MKKTMPLRLNHEAISCSSCSLSQICLPSGLNSNEIEILATFVKKANKVPKSAYLFRKGDTLKGIYAIKAGAVKTLIATAEGEEQILEFHFSGDLLGFDGWGNGHYHCDAIALTDTLVCHLPTQDLFEELCSKVPKLNAQLLHLAGKELSKTQNLLLSLGQLKAEDRMALFLMSLSHRYKVRGLSSKSFHLAMTRQDLANYLGLAVETVSRIFFKLQEQNIIRVQRRLIDILDENRLCEMAHLNCNKGHEFI